MAKEVRDMRENYDKGTLSKSKVNANPIIQFNNWFQQAIDSKLVAEPNAMILSTVSEDGIPSSRTVLFKGLIKNEFTFYTSYKSQKSKEIATNPNVSILFLWKEMEQQIRIVGRAKRLSYELSNDYFQSRPYSSRISAMTSPQSQVVMNRKTLELAKEKVLTQFPEGSKFDCPKDWGGFGINASILEFWQGRPSRLHDRIRYTLDQIGNWKIERLAP